MPRSRRRQKTGPQWPDWIEDWIIPFTREPALWPVWLAILGHAVVFIALALLATWRGEGWWGTVAVTMISVGLSGWEIRLFGRPKGVSASVWGSWLLALPTVWLGLQTGFI